MGVGAAVLAGALAFGLVRWLSADDSGDAQADSGRSASANAADGGGDQGDADGGGAESEEGRERDPAAQQAGGVDALLKDSTKDRKTVIKAVRTIQDCTDQGAVASAEKDLTKAAERRDDLVSQLTGLDLGEVGGGRAAAAHLKSAWQHSAEADRAFAEWASTMAGGGCTSGGAPHDADYDRAVSSSDKATRAKKAFVDAWNPIADEHGLPERAADDI